MRRSGILLRRWCWLYLLSQSMIVVIEDDDDEFESYLESYGDDPLPSLLNGSVVWRFFIFVRQLRLQVDDFESGDSYLLVLDIAGDSELTGRYVSLEDQSEGVVRCAVEVEWPK